MHSEETEFKSARMEIVGTRRLIEWCLHRGISIRSITTDRSLAIAKLIEELNVELGLNIIHRYDGWHLVKWLGNRLREASKYSECAILAIWAQALKTHLWNSIEKCEGKDIRHAFNTCLFHLLDIHNWTKNEITGDYTHCSHGVLNAQNRKVSIVPQSKAHVRLEDVIKQKRFQKDLEKASIQGTSRCESKHAVERIYVLRPLHFHTRYSHMTVMHMNTLTEAESNGERTVMRTHEVQLKYLPRKSTRVEMTPVEHPWRTDILNEALRLKKEDRLQRLAKRASKREAAKRELQQADSAMSALPPATVSGNEDDSDDELTDVEIDSYEWNDEDYEEESLEEIASEIRRIQERHAAEIMGGMEVDPSDNPDINRGSGRNITRFAYDVLNGVYDGADEYRTYLSALGGSHLEDYLRDIGEITDDNDVT